MNIAFSLPNECLIDHYDFSFPNNWNCSPGSERQSEVEEVDSPSEQTTEPVQRDTPTDEKQLREKLANLMLEVSSLQEILQVSSRTIRHLQQDKQELEQQLAVIKRTEK